MNVFNFCYLAVIFCTLTACSGRPAPAPVVELYQGKTFHQVAANSKKGAKTYKVQQGDTLYSIAWQTGQDYRDIARINRITKPYHIYPGQKLSLSAIPKRSKKTIRKPTGQTLKTKGNQTLDPRKKQAYGKATQVVNKKTTLTTKRFPGQVGRWQWPAEGKLIKRFSSTEQGNNGIDISNKQGTAIKAAAMGKVVYTGDALRGYGHLVIIKHTESFLTAYAHNDKILVKEQQWVKRGQKISLMGNSGAQNNMLHFEVRYKGKSVDPLRFLPKKNNNK